jgi:GT2 family glycosyltransferase
MVNQKKNRVAVVVIGRNEGERLACSLDSLSESSLSVSYVDSGSSDDSVVLAKCRGVHTIELDSAKPFSAARARNEGFIYHLKISPNIEFIQFLDGDCEISHDWLETAVSFFDKNPDVAVVAGRLREKNPELSVYNKLCDFEWSVPTGQAISCGGISLMRVSALKTVGGFREDLVAGEEPELCLRLRLAGWKIWRLNAEMARHDAAMFHFSEWWKRCVRTGFGYAQLCHDFGLYCKESMRCIIWAGVLPILTILSVLSASSLMPSVLLLLPIIRVILGAILKGNTRDSWLLCSFQMLGKFPEFQGLLRYVFNRLEIPIKLKSFS